MGSVDVTVVQRRLDTVIEGIEQFNEFLSCHMVNFLTDKHWNRFVPEDVRKEIRSSTDVSQAIEALTWQCNSKMSEQFPALAEFLLARERQRLASCPELLTTLEQLESLLPAATNNQASVKEFMSAKKCHEVEATAALIDKLLQSTPDENQYIIDAGDGKGYLSSRMALQYGHRVLGIDANVMNTENALSRNRKLQRAWNGLTERAELQIQGITPTRRGKKSTPRDAKTVPPSLDKYKTTARFITNDLNLVELLAENFVDVVNPSICLTGLHTCGNLAATCLRVFHAHDSCRILLNVGCCYHLLRERFSQEEFYGNKALMEQQTDDGFPLSQYLQQKRVRLGRNARMLAAQSMERTLASKEPPNITLYYRALLEVLVCRHAPHLKNELQVGRIQKCNNFSEYIKKCSSKLNAPWLAAVEEQELDSLLQQYEEDKHFLELFYLLRMTFAPIIESIILLDRLLYLKELGYERSYLVDLFDAVVSPRHYAIIAIKP